MGIGIIGLGSYLPERVITNADICSWTGVTEEWIEQRTGIRERRYATPGMVTSDLAARAARAALSWQDGPGDDRLAALVVATCTPDVPQPATAAIVQHKLTMRSVPAFDVNSVCAGFVFGLAVAEGMLARQGGDATALLIGADMFSTIMDRTDRRTVTLFGDGAGAAVLGTVPDGYGIRAIRLVTDGDRYDEVTVRAGGTRTPLDAAALARGDHLFRMNGPLVKSYVIASTRKLVFQTLDEAGLRLDDIDRFVFHQANMRLLEALADDLGVSMDRVPTTVGEFGNTAAASVAVTLDESHRARPIARGERILITAAGGGLCTGAVVMTWY
ncbi:3-oxoacyl-ACP synthase III family protein [Streptomyces sp. NBC_00878]|uniref:3-oxoacyl-ACP synthase III family protein n=1 Tax=Streptomyces sp. NBC_00878 TaxID=2975854 RepID=UPI002251973D|nr:ketoacyl-ACP synthase III [Streptomyces sp. NBC_00878]MCX4911447.1 ketoacyl-ACP synthase III [Streptomyces sp. NBC_00878]